MQPALLALADGSLFPGESIGFPGQVVGEVVFNTAMCGYQEILTDPSYARQIVTLTYPHVGNTGINDEDMESAKPFAAGLVIRDLPVRMSSYRASRTLPEFLEQRKMVALAGIDTRRLTRILRERGRRMDVCGPPGRESASARARQSRPRGLSVDWSDSISRRRLRRAGRTSGPKAPGCRVGGTGYPSARNSTWSPMTSESNGTSSAVLWTAAAVSRWSRPGPARRRCWQ